MATCDTPWRISRKVKSAAPARPSNHTAIWIFPGAFIVLQTNSGARGKLRLPQDKKPRSRRYGAERRPINSGDLRRRSRLFDAHQGRFANKGDARSQNQASPHRLTCKQTKRQPQNTERDCRQHVGQKMRTQSDATESHEANEKCRTGNRYDPPMARFERGQDKKQEWSVKQSCSDRMTAG